MSDLRWGHAQSRDAESWSGCYLTREEAILDGRADYCGEAFWIHSGYLVSLDALLPDVDDLLADISDRAGDEAGEAAEDYPSVTPTARKELKDLLWSWAERHIKPEFWVADGDVELIPALDGEVKK